MLNQFNNPQAASDWCNQMRKQGKTIGFVATMGALHDGHASLIDRSKLENDLTILSIFVNPLQFNRKEDLVNYPRNESADTAFLIEREVNAVFTGSPEQILGDSSSKSTEQLTDPGIFALSLEGEFRPGHFAGVREVVSRLFDFVGPCNAYFGEKDFQQVEIIRQLAREKTAVKVVACPTLRQDNGLARSSRNFRLSDQGLEGAVIIYRAMQAANSLWNAGERKPFALQTAMLMTLDNSQFDIEYAELRDPLNWTIAQPNYPLQQARVFIAGNIEGVRLLDNMELG